MKGMANRYSLAVGLIFLALVVVASLHAWFADPGLVPAPEKAPADAKPALAMGG